MAVKRGRGRGEGIGLTPSDTSLDPWRLGASLYEGAAFRTTSTLVSLFLYISFLLHDSVHHSMPALTISSCIHIYRRVYNHSPRSSVQCEEVVGNHPAAHVIASLRRNAAITPPYRSHTRSHTRITLSTPLSRHFGSHTLQLHTYICIYTYSSVYIYMYNIRIYERPHIPNLSCTTA